VREVSPLRRRKSESEGAAAPPDYLDRFLAEPAGVGTSDADVEAVENDDTVRAADQVRVDRFVKTEEILDGSIPRRNIL
jgi:hypothetical protein